MDDGLEQVRIARIDEAPGAEEAGRQRLVLRVADCDQDALRATVRAASEGYHLVRWPGVAPSDLIGPFAATREALNDAPQDGLAHGGEHWDEARVRRQAETYAADGGSVLTVAAVCLDGEGNQVVAGFSEIVLHGGAAAAVANQYDTVVRRDHRGRGLGLWVKAAMLQWLLGAHPEVEQVVTTCAPGNTHMIAINEQLGFRRESAG
ncbi:GNAT family N-acetyltransferase [Streptacidiphilus sp. EB129]|uniref:GNAT family N-acetyltransferase n=1 Tax=Streptacidiphilus sp. EB129 TaxID=3156262 RepID=UPI003514B894